MSKMDVSVGEAVSFPPQSSIKLESHGKDEQRYYTWEIKIYCDDLDVCRDVLVKKNKEMMDYVKTLEKDI